MIMTNLYKFMSPKATYDSYKNKGIGHILSLNVAKIVYLGKLAQILLHIVSLFDLNAHFFPEFLFPLELIVNFWYPQNAVGRNSPTYMYVIFITSQVCLVLYAEK